MTMEECLRKDFKHKITGSVVTFFGLQKGWELPDRVWIADYKGTVVVCYWELFLKSYELVED